jgi:hypothetical protein
MTIHKYINKLTVYLLRYAEEKFRKCIQCARSSGCNTEGKGTQKQAESKRCRKDFAGTRLRIRARKGSILQGQRSKEDTKEPIIERHSIVSSISSFFSIMKSKWLFTLLLIDMLDSHPSFAITMLKSVYHVWRCPKIDTNGSMKIE